MVGHAGTFAQGLSRRQFLRGIGALGASAGLRLKPHRRRPTLHIHNWSNYMPLSAVKRFESWHDCTIDYREHPTDAGIEQIIRRGQPADIVVPSNETAERLIADDLLAPLEKAQLSNFHFIAERFRNLPYDPEGQFTVPYLWGTTGLGWLFNNAGAGEPSWTWLTDTAVPVSFPDDPRGVFAAGLKALGLPANPRSTEEIDQAAEWLQAIVVSSRNRVFLEEPETALQESRVQRACLYSGSALAAVRKNSAIRYGIPVEGCELWVDCLAIPTHCSQKDLAHRFINMILIPEVAAEVANHTFYASPNVGSYELTLEEIVQNPSLYPPTEFLDRCEISRAMDAPLADHLAKAWSQLKATAVAVEK